MNHVRFFVPGLALPQGSAKAFVVKGKARITSTTKGLAGWRERIALAAHGAGVPYREEGAVEVEAAKREAEERRAAEIKSRADSVVIL